MHWQECIETITKILVTLGELHIYATNEILLKQNNI